MNRRLVTWLIVSMIPMLVSCAGSRVPMVVGPVGPEKETVSSRPPTGYIKVYSATDQHNDGDLHYYSHSEYSVYSPDNKLVKRVPNAIGIHDEDPSLVELPAGAYTILARSEHYGMVRVKIIVKAGEQTTVNLEYKKPPTQLTAAEAGDLVRLPNGTVVGTRANAAPAETARP